MKKLYLVDASNMFFRAYYAINPSLKSSTGLPTNALYGFLAMTVKLLNEIHPDYIAYCFDRPEPSFRKDIDSNYKANRAEMPEDLIPQIPYVKKLTDALGIARLEMVGFEADDLIGTLVHKGRAQQCEVVIVSGDKDFAQLVSAHTVVHDTMKDVIYDTQTVKAKWGVEPSQFIDFLAIMGDASDNIPGVKGVGKVGAEKLLKEFGSLENIYENLDRIKSPSLRSKLEISKDQAFVSKKLVTILTDIDLPQTLNDLKLKPIHLQELRDLLGELDFKNFERKLIGNEDQRLDGENSSQQENQESASELDVVTLAELAQQVIEGEELWGLNTDRGLFFAQGERVFRVAAEPEEMAPIFDRLKPLWCGYDLKTLWSHLKLDNHPRFGWDQMLAAYVVKPGPVPSFMGLSKLYLGPYLSELPSPSQLYKAHIKIREVLTARLVANNNLQVLTDIELPLIPVLYRMENKGIHLDVAILQEQSRELAVLIESLEKEITQLAGHSFNIASPKQLAEILFGKLGLPPGRKTKTGYSTNSEVLEKLKSAHPICEKIIEYRELTKLKSTYVDALPDLVNPKTQRIHTHFHQALTTTGRLSSSHPNMQNIPIRTERGSRIRRAFIADSDKVLLSCDYSQIELRILAHITGDEGLCRAFSEDLDIHSATASEVFDVPLSAVTSDLRRMAKAINFGLAYGQGVFGLAESLGISRQEAKEIIDRYFVRFPKVAEYMKDVVQTARDQGYVETVFGRRRYLEDINSQKGNLRSFAERAAINAPIQGTASDLVKLAMISIDEVIPLPLILQVHDELIFEGTVEDCEAHLDEIRRIMESAAKFRVPLRVNASMGKSWEDAH